MLGLTLQFARGLVFILPQILTLSFQPGLLLLDAPEFGVHRLDLGRDVLLAAHVVQLCLQLLNHTLRDPDLLLPIRLLGPLQTQTLLNAINLTERQSHLIQTSTTLQWKTCCLY